MDRPDDPVSVGAEQPELAVVVISVNAPPSLTAAVASLAEQDIPLEVVVVNTGGCDAAPRLASISSAVTLVEKRGRHLPGAARNLGIAAAKSEYIAFLACDCRAAPDWARQRLRWHKLGHVAVGSALLPDNEASAIAWASHLSLFVRRLPQASRVWALPYGASFHRSVFETHGQFSEHLRTGEDTEFVARLPAPMKPFWARSVVTYHNSPTTPIAMIIDQYRRGRRASATMRSRGRALLLDAARQFWWRTRVPIQMVRHTELGRKRTIRRALALVPLCAAAYSLGLAAGRGRVDLST
jgi:glycosyltransferase involved in cell wall biosynthesis